MMTSAGASAVPWWPNPPSGRLRFLVWYSPMPGAVTTSVAPAPGGRSGNTNWPRASVVVWNRGSSGVADTMLSSTLSMTGLPSSPGYWTSWMRTDAPAIGLPSRSFTTPTNGTGRVSLSWTSPSTRSVLPMAMRKKLAGASPSL